MSMPPLFKKIYFENNIHFRIQYKFLRPFLEFSYYLTYFSKALSTKGIYDSSKLICIYSGLNNSWITPFDILLAVSLKQSGYCVLTCLYSPSYIYHELFSTRYNSPYQFLLNCTYHLVLRLLGIRVLIIDKKSYTISSQDIPLLTSINELRSLSVDNYPTGEFAYQTLIRVLKTSQVDSDPDTLRLARNLYISSLQNYYFSRDLLEKHNFVAILMSHGINLTWSPIFKLSEASNIKTICYDRAKTKSTININLSQPSPDWSFDQLWEKNRNKELSDKHRIKAIEYLNSRKSQLDDVFQYNLSKSHENSSLVKHLLSIPTENIVVTAFSNVAWDATAVSRDIIFSNFNEAILRTAQFLSEFESVTFVVRPHPAEFVLNSKEKLSDSIKGLENVILCDKSINSFDVLDITDISIVHTSTVGLESSILGIPTIVLGAAPYRDKGFTIDPCSLDAYYNSISNLIHNQFKQITQDYTRELALKYFYLMMFEYQKKIPIHYRHNIFNGYTSQFPEILTDSTLSALINLLNSR